MRFFRVFLLFLVPLAVAAEGYLGVGVLFDLGMGPLGPGMGGVALGLGLQPESGFYEPASLGLERDVSLSLGYRRPFGAIGCVVAGLSGGGLGLYALNLDGGEVSDGFRYQAYGIVLAAGLGSGKASLGIRWKGLFVPTRGGMAWGWAVDPGLVLRLDGVALGIRADNVLMAPIDYGGHTEDWPWRVAIDLWSRLPVDHLSLYLGGSLGDGWDVEFTGGLIASLGEMAFWAGVGAGELRAGAIFRARGLSLGVLVGMGQDLPLSFGASLDYTLAGRR